MSKTKVLKKVEPTLLKQKLFEGDYKGRQLIKKKIRNKAKRKRE